jgi:hypothetical protein
MRIGLVASAVLPSLLLVAAGTRIRQAPRLVYSSRRAKDVLPR